MKSYTARKELRVCFDNVVIFTHYRNAHSDKETIQMSILEFLHQTLHEPMRVMNKILEYKIENIF